MRIGVYGYTDKRPVVYALLKLLSATGDVALFSSNRHYKRLLDYGESKGHMANVMIAVSDASPDEIFEEIGYNADDFDHIIFDLQDTMPEQLSLVLHVKGYKPGEDEQAFLELLDDCRTVKMMYDGKKERGCVNVPPLSTLWRAVEQIEAFRLLLPLPSDTLNKGLAAMLAPLLNMKEKAVVALLKRRALR